MFSVFQSERGCRHRGPAGAHAVPGILALALLAPAAALAQVTWRPTSTIAAPSPREGHVAVWTGSRMIVWGGSVMVPYGYDYLDTGGVYDPASDSWTAMSTASAPWRRIGASAVWTGTKMLIWGGWGDVIGYLDTGGSYDPATDTWTALSMTGAPSPRTGHTAVWTGEKMIVWGGSATGTGLPMDSGAAYDPATDSWTAIPANGKPLINSTAVWTGSKMILWGGQAYTTDPRACGGPPVDHCHEPVNTGSVYDPVTNSWGPTAIAAAPAPRTGHTAVWIGSNMVVWGGSSCCTVTGPNGPRDDGGAYDPATDSWTALGTTEPPSARESHTAVWAGTGMIVWGGFLAPGGGAWDAATNSWTPTGTSLPPEASLRRGHTAVWTGSRMVVWGGLGNASLDTGGIYDPRGVFVGPTRFHTVTPCRIVDTREAPTGFPVPLRANGTRSFAAVGRCDIPASAKAVSLNVTALQGTVAGDLRLYALGNAMPATSVVNYGPGQTRASNATVYVGDFSQVAVHVDQSLGFVDVILDVNGYYE